MIITADLVREYLHYNPDTGEFHWIKKPNDKIMVDALAGCPCKTNAKPYWRIAFKGRLHLLHRLAWLYVHGKWPENQIDHINGDQTDNRLANLREATSRQNHYNTGLRRDSTSGHKGVSWQRRDKRWSAQITINGRGRYLGQYREKADAVAAYAAAAREHFGEFARPV